MYGTGVGRISLTPGDPIRPELQVNLFSRKGDQTKRTRILISAPRIGLAARSPRPDWASKLT